jgi:hypothetical protein
MGSEKPTGADNQQGSRKRSSSGRFLTPQRLHAELLGTWRERLGGLPPGSAARWDAQLPPQHPPDRPGRSTVARDDRAHARPARSSLVDLSRGQDACVLDPRDLGPVLVGAVQRRAADRDERRALLRAGLLRRRGWHAAGSFREAVPTALPERSREPGDGPRDPRELGDTLRSGAQPERARGSRLLEVLRQGRITSAVHDHGGILASKKAPAAGQQDEDIVHAP